MLFSYNRLGLSKGMIAPPHGGSKREQTLAWWGMPIVSPIPLNPLIDGRQSERAMLVRRGVQHLLMQMGAHVMPEISLASGRRADLVAITRTGEAPPPSRPPACLLSWLGLAF